MSERQRDFPSLMRLVSHGSQEAARELIARYGKHVLRAIRMRLPAQLRSKFDSADFVQAVWASFFALPLIPSRFDHPGALIGFLMRLASNKVVEVVRQRMQTQKFSVLREQFLVEDCDCSSPDLVSPEPGPEAVAIAREEWARLLHDQPEQAREILVALGSGDTQREVAHRLGINESTVRRVVRRVAPRYADERD